MKTKALILFFPFALFFAEMISFPTKANSTCKTMMCMKMKGAMKCPHKKENSKPAGNCDNSAACSVCPVCSIFTFQPEYVWPLSYTLLKKVFRLKNTNLFSSYTHEVWKPPNDYLHN